MPDWKDEIARALQGHAEEVLPTSHENVVKEVLAEVNRQDFFRAIRRTQQIGNLTRIDVITYPRRHPAERSIMIPIAVSAAGYVSVPTPAGMGYLDDPSPDGLRDFLIKTFTSETFSPVISHYRSRNEEIVQAWLKRIDYRRVDLADQSVLVEPHQQDVLVTAYEAGGGQQVEVIGELLEPFGNYRPYDASVVYRMFDSSGYVIEGVEHELLDARRLRVRGTPKLDVDWMRS